MADVESAPQGTSLDERAQPERASSLDRTPGAAAVSVLLSPFLAAILDRPRSRQLFHCDLFVLLKIRQQAGVKNVAKKAGEVGSYVVLSTLQLYHPLSS